MLGGVVASVVLYGRLRDVHGHLPSAEESRPWRNALRAMRPLMVPLIGIITTRAFLLSALTLYLPTFLSEEGSGLWMAGASLSVLEAAGIAGALTGGSISDRLGRRRVLLVSMMGTALLMFVFLAVSGWQRVPLLVLTGFTALAVTPVVMAIVQESVPENRALANGIYMSLSFGIRSVAVVIMGVLGDLFGLRMAFTASAVLVLLGLPILFLLPGKPSGQGGREAGQAARTSP
jgi:FSR family fosmidomycin resistance protein-like MFS transporter